MKIFYVFLFRVIIIVIIIVVVVVVVVVVVIFRVFFVLDSLFVIYRCFGTVRGRVG